MQLATIHAALDAAEAAPVAEVADIGLTVTPADSKAPLPSPARVADGDTEAEETETAETDAAETKADDAEATETPEAAKPERAAESDVFSDAALATPEGQAAARKWLQDGQKELLTLRATHSRQIGEFNKRLGKVKRREETVRGEQEKLIQIGTEQRLVANSLLTGGAKEIAAALGRITGRDPIPLIREMSMLIATNGKDNGKGDPKVEKLEAELAAFKATQEEREKKAAAQQEEAAIAHQMELNVSTVIASPKFPLLAAYANESPKQREFLKQKLAEDMWDAHNAGRTITLEQAARELELQEEADQKASPAASESGAAQAAKPAPALVAKQAQGLTSKDTSAAPKRRPRGEPETVEELAADPGFLRQLGLG